MSSCRPPWGSSLNGTHFADIIDARRRLLAPGGQLIPQTDTMMAAVVSVPEAFDEDRRPWRATPWNLDLTSALQFVESTPKPHRGRPEELLCEPVAWARLHYPALTQVGIRGKGTCRAARDGTAHGLLTWFDCELVPGVGFTNTPGTAGFVYGQKLFPWPEAVRLREGDQLDFELRADTVAADVVWTWTTDIRRPSDPSAEVRRFRQSNFRAGPVTAKSLRRRAAHYVPRLSPRGGMVLQALEAIRAGRSVGAIARDLQGTYPERFLSIEDAHGFVAELAERYGE